MDVGTWLNSLGLDQYTDLFREQAIEADVLAELTEQHLIELGIPLGHRLRLLRAIGELAEGGRPVNGAQPFDAPERRQLTVLFCDLVGSTELTAQLDPEDMADLIRAFQGAVATAVGRFEGHIAKWMGDAAMVYFGYPRAHEDDAERAARAGLALIKAIARAPARARRRPQGAHRHCDRPRRGRRTDRRGRGARARPGRRYAQSRDAAAVARRARQHRGVGSDAAAARRDLRAEAARAATTLDGFAAPVPAWRIASERENVSRFEASRSEVLTPFVGREDEIALLLERWRRAVKGEGQVVMLSGEAGIGKSRILATLRERLRGENHLTLRYQCSPHHINDAFHPVIGQVWHAAGFVSGEPADARLDKLESDARAVAGVPIERDRAVPCLAAGDPDRRALSAARTAAERIEGAHHGRADRAGRRRRQTACRC